MRTALGYVRVSNDEQADSDRYGYGRAMLRMASVFA